jgi:type II secretory pathway component PulF
MFADFIQKINYMRFGRAKQQAFVEDLNSLIEDGVPVTQAITAIGKIASDKITREVTQSILGAVGRGQKLSDGMEGWFPQTIVEIIRVGEEGGTLTETMRAAVKTLSQNVSIIASLLSSLIYPLVVLLLACVVGIFLKHSIFDNFAAIKPIATWPANGRQFMFFVTFIERWWWTTIIMIFGLGFAFHQIFQKFTGEYRKLIDFIPPFSLYRSVVAAGFMEIMGLLVSNGVTIKEALAIVQRKATHYLTWHIYMMQLRLSGGKDNIAEVLDTGLISTEDITRLMVVAEGKGFEHALVRLGALAVEKNDKKMQLVGKLAGGILMALDAMFAIFMILAVYSVGVSLTGGSVM